MTEIERLQKEIDELKKRNAKLKKDLEDLGNAWLKDAKENEKLKKEVKWLEESLTKYYAKDPDKKPSDN